MPPAPITRHTGPSAALKHARSSLLADPLGGTLRAAIVKSCRPWQGCEVDASVLDGSEAAAACAPQVLQAYDEILETKP